jgi:tetratricopeptide (TPR) repeat protein
MGRRLPAIQSVFAGRSGGRERYRMSDVKRSYRDQTRGVNLQGAISSPGLCTRTSTSLAAEQDLARATRDGDIPAALRIANTLIRLEPESAAHHYTKALLCQHQSEIELAVYEFMQAIWLDPDGPNSEHARSFLQDLDILQLHQISVLADEDLVFRTKLARNCQEAAMERGFALSPVGEQLLREYCERGLSDSSPPARVARYH